MNQPQIQKSNHKSYHKKIFIFYKYKKGNNKPYRINNNPPRSNFGKSHINQISHCT